MENRMKKSKGILSKSWLFLFFAILLIVIFFNSSLSKVHNIEIIGNNLLKTEDILATISLKKNDYYFLFNSEKAKAKLEQNNIIKKVVVEKKFFGKIKIIIEEQKIVAFLQSNNNWLPVLENGIVLWNYPWGNYIDRPLISKYSSERNVQQLARELAKVSNEALNKISEIIDVPNEKEPNLIIVYTKDHIKIFVRLNEFADRLNLYPQIVEELKTKNDKSGILYMLDAIWYEKGSSDKIDTKNLESE